MPHKLKKSSNRKDVFQVLEPVKKFIPELSYVSKKFIHNPWDMSTELQSDSHCIIGKDYPAPIVDLKETRNRALLAFKSIS